ncbi:retrovirus-related pol polyprotein from transposon TNT 1-94 [Tanacetum coccineum]
MQEELLQFKLQQVWKLVDFPNGKRAIRTKWVFKNKKDERGIVIRNKARLVAQGHRQKEGKDYEEVFPPVSRIEAIRLFLAYASFMGFLVYQMDVKSAFLYGTIEEEVYVYQTHTTDLKIGTSDKVYKWSRHLWFASSHQDHGFVPPLTKGVWIYDNPDLPPVLQKVSALAAEDTQFALRTQQELDLLFGPLYNEFFNDGTSRVNKSSFPTDNSAPQDTHPSTNIYPTTEPSTPTNVHAEENNENQADDTEHEFTNPFCTPVQESCEGRGMGFEESFALVCSLEDIRLFVAYADTSDKLVSWMSKKQECTAMSSAEAEYVALSASCAQVILMRTQLKDYGFNYNKIPLYCDSQSAIAISCNPVHHSRTKHIHTRYHFIKEQVENGIIELYFVRTEYQLVDMFTKSLTEYRF